MKKNYLIILLLFTYKIYSQEISTYKSLINYANLSDIELLNNCPHFPIKGTNENLKEWIRNYESEVVQFMNIEEIKNVHPSYIDLKIEHLKPYIFKHYIWDLYNKLTPTEKNILTKHIPVPVLTGNLAKDFALYEKEIYFWKTVYTQEYVNLNKHFVKDFNFQFQAKFLGKPVTKEKPKQKDFTTKLDYYLTLQNWYFVYEYDSFKEVFGFEPKFISSFNLTEYLNKMKNPEEYEEGNK